MAEFHIHKADSYNWLVENKRKFRLIYIDPPFNTGKKFIRKGIGYKDTGFKINSCVLPIHSATDTVFGGYSDYLMFLHDRIILAKQALESNGSFFIHLDYRTVHYVKVMLDTIFGQDNFMNEIIWAYDYGGRPKKYWPRKHDTILWYVKDKNNYIFNYEEMDRIPYMSPKLVGKEKAKKGKTPTDVWWHTIVPTNSREKTGYPTQKPVGILGRIVKVHSNPGDWLLDFFAGSGSFGIAAVKNNRNVVLVDNNQQAIEIMRKRFKDIIGG